MRFRPTILLGLSLLLIGAACVKPTAVTTTNTATPVRPYGLSFSPAAYTAAGFTDFFTLAPQAGSFVSWAGATTDLSKSSGGPNLVLSQAKQHALTPVIIVSPTSSDLKTAAAWQSWHDLVVDFAKRTQAPYFGVGNEINTSMTAANLAFFGGKFSTLMSDIHAVSPQTNVFVTLQYEWLQGMRGGLFGGKNAAAQNQWSATSLKPFLTGDIVAFTSYPSLVYKNPADIPSDYYRVILEHITVPVALTELGWFRVGPTGWDSSAAEQAAFIKRFGDLTAAVKPIFSLWSFLYDPAAAAPFSTMGLLKPGQTDSEAWRAWTTLR